MRGKKFLCLLLTGALTIGAMMTVSAAESADVQNMDVSSGNVTVSGNGDVRYLDTNIYNVQLPTNTAFGDVVVDPLGLYGLTEDNVDVTLEDLDAKAGKIFTTRQPRITNKSSVPMLVSAKFKLDTAADILAAEDVEKVHVSGNNPANQLLMYAVPSAVDVEDGTTDYVRSSKGIVVSSNDVTAEFVLPAADYVVSVSTNNALKYVLADGAKGHGTAIGFEGLVNKYADWSEYAGSTPNKKIELSLVFEFTSKVGNKVADESSGAYAMVTPTAETIELEDPRNVLTSNGSNAIVYYYTNGKPSSVTITNGSATGAPPFGSTYAAVDGDKVTFTAAYINLLKTSSGYGTGSYTVKFDTNETFTMKIE